MFSLTKQNLNLCETVALFVEKKRKKENETKKQTSSCGKVWPAARQGSDPEGVGEFARKTDLKVAMSVFSPN